MPEREEGIDVISIEEAKEQVALTSRRLGLLHLAFAEVLVNEMGEEEGKKCVARAIKEYSKKIGNAKRDKVSAMGLDPSAETFFDVSDLPNIGMHEGVEEVEVDGEKRIRAYGCVMGRVWKDLGASELGRIYCYVDPASSMAFDQRCKYVHTKAIPDGDDYCELVMRSTTEKDKEEFASADTDWDSVEQGRE